MRWIAILNVLEGGILLGRHVHGDALVELPHRVGVIAGIILTAAGILYLAFTERPR